MTRAFPEDFVFGASTAAYQIEGAWNVDGRGESIWDRFSHTPGAIRNGETGDVACDHYHRYAEDLDLVARAGLSAYRFSTSWSRLFPRGDGARNAAGFEFYDRVVDGCLAREIDPWLCFYHWDLPQALHDRGGWENRDVVAWFADYAGAVAEHFAGRVNRFVMFNEPGVFVELGYRQGIHAPGIASLHARNAAMHHVNLATAEGLRRVRVAAPAAQLGTVLAVTDFQPASPASDDIEACETMDAENVLAYGDPLFFGTYPPRIVDHVAPHVREGDMERLREPIDFLGVNHYSRMTARAGADGAPEIVDIRDVAPATLMRWEIWPRSLFNVLVRLRERYGDVPLYITENGMASLDERRAADGSVADDDRIAYLHGCLSAAADAMAAGVDLRGYLIWTLLDNFEWAQGFVMRFGLVEVADEARTRVPKQSYHWYARLARTRRLPPPETGLRPGSLPIRPVHSPSDEPRSRSEGSLTNLSSGRSF